MLKYELKKIFVKRLNRILLIAALFLVIAFGLFAACNFHFVSERGSKESGPGAARKLVAEKNRWKGTLTPAVLAKVTSETQKNNRRYPNGQIPEAIYGKTEQSYKDINEMINVILSGGGEYRAGAIMKITPAQAKNLYRIREKNIGRFIRKYRRDPAVKKFLRRQYDKVKTPFYYEAADPWRKMDLYAGAFGVILVILVAVLTSGIFADEFETGACAIFFTTCYGRTKGIRRKIFTGLITATAVYGTGIGLLSAVVFSITGVSGAGTCIQIENSYAVYALTHAQQYALILFCGYIAALLSAAVSMLISAKSHSVSLAVCVPILLFCAMPFIGRVLPFDTFFELTPDQLLNLYTILPVPFVYHMGPLVFRQVPCLMIMYLVVTFALLPLIYRVSRCAAGG